jgi:K+-sensing histidine kinase KdpD
MHSVRFIVKSVFDNSQLFPVDSQRMLQVLINLLSNAIKFSYPNSYIKIEMDRNETMLIVKVRDQGIGIAPEFQRSIFLPYYKIMNQQSKRLNPNGNGLGLSICARICKSLNGYIDCFSQVSMGTCMTFGMQISDGINLIPTAQNDILLEMDLNPYDFESHSSVLF